MNPHTIAWECAVALSEDFPDRLTPEQLIRVHVSVMRGPDAADLDCIALACRVIEVRT